MQKTNKNLNSAVALQNTHAKLLALDLLSLTQSPFPSSDSTTSFSRRGIPISLVETVGTVTLRDLKHQRFLRFARIMGLLSRFKGAVQLTVSDVLIERDPSQLLQCSAFTVFN